MDASNNIALPSFDSFPTGTDVVGTQTSSSYNTIMSVVATAQNTVFDWVWRDVFGISLLLSMALLIAILYASIRTKQVREIEDAQYTNSPLSSAGSVLFHSAPGIQGGTSIQAKRWKEIMLHVQSSNPTNWRQAIIEADIMLDSAITGKGYFGESLGEKMKQVSRGDINSIDDAWEAHKVRNKIAHDGSDYDLNEREARRIIGLYENVFKELEYI